MFNQIVPWGELYDDGGELLTVRDKVGGLQVP